MSSLVDLLARRDLDPDRTVLRIDDARWSARTLDAAVASAAGYLRAQGLHRGDRLLLQGPKVQGWLAVHLAALRLGIATAPLNPRAPAAEVARAAALIRPQRAILSTPDAVPGALDAATALPDALSHRPTDHRDDDDDALALIGFTSGTTGEPKGVPLRHRHLAATVAALRDLWQLGPDDVLLHALPLFHIHGLVVAQHTLLAAGGCTVWRDRFDAAEVLAQAHAHGVTVLMGVPTFWHRLLALPNLALPPSLRLCTSGSAPLPAADHAAFLARTGRAIVERYGMTEVGIVLSNLPSDARADRVGLPVGDTEIRLVDAHGIPVEEGRVGELWVRGSSVFDGYLDRPDATAAAFHDGWFATGDLGARASDGSVRLAGRRSALILSGGFNVYPEQVEAALCALPGVHEAGVTGVSSDDLGAVPVASVVCDDAVDVAALRDALRDTLSAYAIPRHIARTTALPRNALGKLQRPALASLWRAPVCREAAPSDIDRLAAWNVAMAHETEGVVLDPEVARRGVAHGLAHGGARYVIAELGGGLPVGQLMITTEWSDWRDAWVWWIQSVYVPPAWRRRGILAALFDDVTQRAHDQGIAGLRLYVDRRNTGAAAAYRALGWDGDHYAVFERMLDR